MKPSTISAFDMLRQEKERARTQALESWLRLNPANTINETHCAAFLAGYDAAAGPMPPTLDEFVKARAEEISREAELKKQRLTMLPAGTCPECEGAGELVGALHCTPCDACSGTGRLA